MLEVEENIQKNTNNINISNTTIKAILDLLKNGEARIQCNTHKDILFCFEELAT
jgi:CRISPR/Cas system CSM-associated protein Csm2 small subunit